MVDEGTYGLHRSGRRAGRTGVLRFGQARHGPETYVDYHTGGQLLVPSYGGELPVILYAGFTSATKDELDFITYENVPSPSRYQGLHSRLAKGVYLSPSMQFATFVAGTPAYQNVGIASVDASELNPLNLVIDPEITVWAEELQDDIIGYEGARKRMEPRHWEPNPTNGLWTSASNRKIPVGFLYIGSVRVCEVVDYRKSVQ